MQLIDIYRGNLTTLLKQAAHFDAHVPTHVITSIKEARNEIATRKAFLSKIGYPIGDWEGDTETIAPSVESQPTVPFNAAHELDTIRAKIRLIRRLLDEIDSGLDNR